MQGKALEDLATIINELAAPVKTFRVFAIEKAIKTGASNQLLDELQKRRRLEEDPECRMLLDHAIETVQERLNKPEAPPAQSKSKVTPAEFARMSAGEQLQAIKKTGGATFRKDGGAAAIQILWQATPHAIVKAEIIKKCSQFWPPELADLLEKCLSDSSPVLQLTSLEAIINCFPDRLQKNFDRLVMSGDPLIRATAIRGLARKHPESAAVFLAESLRKGDYYTRLAALRAISVMPFNLNRSSLIELLVNEQDERLLKIVAAIILANPDREIPFRICDIIEKAPANKQNFLIELQKNCCAMIRMAEICPDFKLFLATLKKYPNRIKARLFVQNCINSYEGADEATRSELVNLLIEKKHLPEVAEAIAAAGATTSHHELLERISRPQAPTKAAPEKVVDQDSPEAWLKKLLRIRTSGDKGAGAVIEKIFSSKPAPAVLSAAFRAAAAIGSGQWCEKARQCLRSENEDLVAAALEYLATFDNDSFLLQIRIFINSSSMIIRTALLRSLCQRNPENARDLLASMLADKEIRVREKAVASLIHFEFSGIRDLLTAFLEKEKSIELVSSGLTFYLANPVLESTYDLHKLGQSRSELQKMVTETSARLSDLLAELNIADHGEILNYVNRRVEKDRLDLQNEDARKESARLTGLATRIKWNSLADSMEELSQYYPLLKKIFLAAMLLLALFFFLAGSEEEVTLATIEGYTPVASQVQDFVLTVQKVEARDGSLLALDGDRQKIMALPRAGKAFVAHPGDRMSIRAIPFRRLPDGTLVVKTIEVKTSR